MTFTDQSHSAIHPSPTLNEIHNIVTGANRGHFDTGAFPQESSLSCTKAAKTSMKELMIHHLVN
jgi:hypothetical protein